MGREPHPTPTHQDVKTLEPESSKDGGRIAFAGGKPSPRWPWRCRQAAASPLCYCLDRARAPSADVHGHLGNLTLLVHSLFISLGERGAGDNNELPDCSQALVFILAALYLDTCPWHCS